MEDCEAMLNRPALAETPLALAKRFAGTVRRSWGRPNEYTLSDHDPFNCMGSGES